jgi:hypothetical protein
MAAAQRGSGGVAAAARFFGGAPAAAAARGAVAHSGTAAMSHTTIALGAAVPSQSAVRLPPVLAAGLRALGVAPPAGGGGGGGGATAAAPAPLPLARHV